MLSFIKYIISPSSVHGTDVDIFPEDRFEDLREIISNSDWDSNSKWVCNRIIDYFIDTNRTYILELKRKDAKINDESIFADHLVRFFLSYH